MNEESARLWDLNQALQEQARKAAKQKAQEAQAERDRKTEIVRQKAEAVLDSPTGPGLKYKQDIYAATLVSTGDPEAAAAASKLQDRTCIRGGRVDRAVADMTKQKLEAAGITAQRVMQEIGRIAFLDIRKLYDDNGDLIPIHKLDADTAAALAAVDVETKWEGKGDAAVPVTVKKVRTVDKMAGLNLLAKHFKLVGDEGDGVNAFASALADRLRSARRRADPAEEVEDAILVEPEQLPYDPEPEPPQPEQEYRYEDDPLG